MLGHHPSVLWGTAEQHWKKVLADKQTMTKETT